MTLTTAYIRALQDRIAQLEAAADRLVTGLLDKPQYDWKDDALLLRNIIRNDSTKNGHSHRRSLLLP